MAVKAGDGPANEQSSATEHRADVTPIRPHRSITTALRAVGLRIELRRIGKLVVPMVSVDRDDEERG